MAKKTVNFNSKGIDKLPKDKPIFYKIIKKRMLVTLLFACAYTMLMSVPFAIAEDKGIEQQGYLKEMQLLRREVFEFRDNLSNRLNQVQQNQQLQKESFNSVEEFYGKTMQNVNLALQGANRATSLVSLFAIIFTGLTFILGFWGVRELWAIKKLRADAEKNIKLAKHINLAYTYMQINLITQAKDEFLKVVEIDEENEVAHTQLGYIFMSLIRPDTQKSKYHSKRATEINRGNYVAYLNLGVVMNRMKEKQEDILTVYLEGEKVAIDKMADDITLGKLKLFAGHCYKNLGKNEKAKDKYNEAKIYFERQENNEILDISKVAKRWLKEMRESYIIVTKKPE